MGNSLSRDTAVARRSKAVVLPLLAVGVLAWVVIVLAVYYRQLWRLLAGSGWESLGVEVIPARAFVAGMVFLAATFVAFLLVARYRQAVKAEGTGVLVYAAGLVLGLGLLMLVNLLAGWSITDLALPYLRDCLKSSRTS